MTAAQQAPDVEQWTAGNDGCGKWAVYVGNETLKGWSGKGKIFVDGLREIDARKLVTAHELALAQVREPLVKDKERLDWVLKQCAGVNKLCHGNFYLPETRDGIDAALTGTEEKR